MQISISFFVNILEILLQQALVGSSPNTLVLSYLKHAVLSQVWIIICHMNLLLTNSISFGTKIS